MASLPRFRLPLDAAEFLSQYWQKKPLLMRQAADGLDFLDGDTLAGLALEDAVESRLIEGSDTSERILRHGPFSEGDFASLPNNSWTLLVQSVDHYLTEVSLLLDSFSFLPAWRIEDIMISYASQGGGVGPHFDHYDVFLVQASGSRRWQLGGHCNSNTPLQPHDSLKLLANMEVTESHLLQPGDVLYLPPGVAHWGTAASDDCITWSVGFRAPGLYQMLDWLLAETEAERTPVLYQDPDLQPAIGIKALDQTDTNSFLQQATAALAQLPCQSLLNQWLSLPRQDTLELVDIDASTLLSLEPNAVLARHGGCRLLAGDAALSHVWINGERYNIEPPARALAQTLLKKRLFTQHELTQLLAHDSAKKLLKEWIDKRFFCSL